MIQYMRRFNGRKYYIRGTYRIKGDARKGADKERNIGENARIITTRRGHTVYSTGKHD